MALEVVVQGHQFLHLGAERLNHVAHFGGLGCQRLIHPLLFVEPPLLGTTQDMLGVVGGDT